MTRKVVYHLRVLSNQNFRKVFVNGKQPEAFLFSGDSTRRRVTKVYYVAHFGA